MAKITRTTKNKITAEEAQATAVAKSSTTKLSDTVTVALNWARSITFEVKDREGRTQTLTLNGNGAPLKGKDMGVLSVGAFGLTPNVPRELWEAVESQCLTRVPFNKWVSKGLIFATDTTRKAEDMSAERKSTRNGDEPIDPTKTRTKAATVTESM